MYKYSLSGYIASYAYLRYLACGDRKPRCPADIINLASLPFYSAWQCLENSTLPFCTRETSGRSDVFAYKASCAKEAGGNPKSWLSAPRS